MRADEQIEERLRAALDEAATRQQVDLPALHAQTRERLSARARAGHRHPGRAVALVAAAVLVVAGVTVTARLVGDRSDLVASSDGSARSVADTFACPSQKTIEHGPDAVDDSFLPELDAGLRPAGEARGAPTYEVERLPGGAGADVELRRGNADGTLASRTTFREGDDGYEPVTTVACSNETQGAPGGADLALLQPGLPDDDDAFTADDFAADAVRLVDRLTYDTTGLATRRTTWAEPCEEGVCLTSGSPSTTMMTSRLPGDVARPRDETTLLADPDDVVGQDSGLRLTVVYDRDEQLTSVAWQGSDGTQMPVEAIDGGGWPGSLYAFIAPSDVIAFVTVGTGADRFVTYGVTDDGFSRGTAVNGS